MATLRLKVVVDLGTAVSAFSYPVARVNRFRTQGYEHLCDCWWPICCVNLVKKGKWYTLKFILWVQHAPNNWEHTNSEVIVIAYQLLFLFCSDNDVKMSCKQRQTLSISVVGQPSLNREPAIIGRRVHASILFEQNISSMILLLWPTFAKMNVHRLHDNIWQVLNSFLVDLQRRLLAAPS